jgi:TonB-dependent SusC/RagA subfamily outer membrane receptor
MKVKIIILFLVLISFAFCFEMNAQKRGRKVVISGRVTDSNHNPFQNAIIMIDGKNTNCITDNEGFYKISVKTSSTNIGIFTIPTGVIEEPIEDRTRINFTIYEDNIRRKADVIPESDDLVEVGYGSVRRKDMIDPIHQIDGSDTKFISYTNIYEMIKSEVPGVLVSGNSITIRGPNSILSSNEPMFVVDGMMVESIYGIPPSQVKSIEVLKGPSASIYGSRGANGVILIQLKTGLDIK